MLYWEAVRHWAAPKHVIRLCAESHGCYQILDPLGLSWRNSFMTLTNQRMTASLRNLFVGDALSMPAHWFYRTADILRYFPPHGITKMEPAPADHPSSIMSLHSTSAGGRRSANSKGAARDMSINNDIAGLDGEVVGDIILKGKRDLWGGQRNHYHHGLPAGENTLNAYCARLMIRHLVANNGYDKDRWLGDYIDFMMASPAEHPDTYAESYHRGFFANLKSGKPLNQCGAVTHDTPSMGALVTVAPLAFALFKTHSLEESQQLCCEHVQLTHPDDFLMKVVAAYVQLLWNLRERPALNSDADTQLQSETFTDVFSTAASVVPGTKLASLVAQKNGDAAVVGGTYSTACYITDSWPSVCYLAAKYYESPDKALLRNTNLGGENAHRGAVLGSLVGLASDEQTSSLYEQLLHRDTIDGEIEQFLGVFGSMEQG